MSKLFLKMLHKINHKLLSNSRKCLHISYKHIIFVRKSHTLHSMLITHFRSKYWNMNY